MTFLRNWIHYVAYELTKLRFIRMIISYFVFLYLKQMIIRTTLLHHHQPIKVYCLLVERSYINPLGLKFSKILSL